MYNVPATKGRRIGAYLIDSVIISAIQIPFLIFAGAAGSILGLIVMVCYYGVTEGSNMSASLGKYLCGLIVVDNQGEPLGYGQAFVRSLCRLLSALVLGVGFLMGLFSADGCTLHDRLAGTFVAQRESGKGYYSGSGDIQVDSFSGIQNNGRQNNGAAQIVGVTGYHEAVVTAGGICVDEIDPSTMESKFVKGLYFVGEVLDLDAYTGGFNLQIAFSTGYAAGDSV